MSDALHLFSYDHAGLVSAFLVAASTCGVALQLKKIVARRSAFRREGHTTEHATQGLSLMRFMTSFNAFFSMYLYGMTLPRFNDYIVWPRVLALLLLLAILHQMWMDRRDGKTLAAFLAGTALFGVSIALAFSHYRLAVHGSGIPYFLLLLSCVFLVHGVGAQVAEIRRTHRTGALSLPMHQLFFVKDASGIWFAVMMGFTDGWPVLAVHGISLCLQAVTMWHFRWARLHPPELRAAGG